MTVFDDLQAECDALDVLVADLPLELWAAPTPAPGWTIAHQIAHLAWTDEQAAFAARSPEAFSAALAEITDPDAYVDAGAAAGADLPPAELLEHWRRTRTDVVQSLREIPPGGRIPWFGPPMAATSMATARLMETWAHGQDVADTLGVRVPATDRIRNVAHIGVRARDYAFFVNGLTPPATEFLVTLTGPSGAVWTWGPADAEQRVTGPALDFALLATRRRHRDDLAVTADGKDASRWLDCAQAFAGPAGQGRGPGQFG
ncbi:MAG: TIGR03084 family metal-binding protein [Streptosporangiaceae bacterium]